MASKQQQTGMRGVYLMGAELAVRGFIVSPTSRSAMGADLLVTNESCKRAYSVQVKTNAMTFGFWLLSKHAKRLVSPTHIYVLVNLREGGDAPEYFVVPSKVLARRVTVERAGKSTWYSFANNDYAKRYRDKWSLFGKAS